jgi:PH (Pleckstrin Homology) domain-containing protein
MLLRRKKLLLFSNKNLDSFAIKINGENDFKASTKNDTSDFEVIDKIKFNDQFENMGWEEILKKWISWLNNIDHENYEYLKSYNLLYLINENEKVQFITEKTRYTNNSKPDIIIVTNVRIMIVKGKIAFAIDSGTEMLGFSYERVKWKLHSSIPTGEIQSIETKKGLLSIFSCTIIIKTKNENEIKINSIKKSIAQEIVDYINDCLANNNRNRIENLLK